ncbi:MAG: ABC transporter ATP-binding/permease protein [Prosthecobacter sp.]|nr:ABC transporter ATP-binding/permease protein [Prosthecobacter sp.]
MLEVQNLSCLAASHEAGISCALNEVAFTVKPGHLLRVVGAPDSGRGRLIRLLAGLERPDSGSLRINNVEVASPSWHPNHLALVASAPGTLTGSLTVRETLMSAHFLRVGGRTVEERVDKVSHLLVGLGMETVATSRVGSLGLAQRRRLNLALALVSDAPLVLCDALTDDLDVKSQQEITALLKYVSEDAPGRVVVHATQSLANLQSSDSVLILHEGYVCFHGPAKAVAHYFSINTVEELYPRLAQRPAERWGESWSRHRDQYYAAFRLVDERPADAALKEGADEGSEDQGGEKLETQAVSTLADPAPLPSVMAQVLHLLRRRWTLWQRNRREWVEHLAMVMLAPLTVMMLVAPNTGYLSELWSQNDRAEVLWPAAYTCSMLLFIQVLLIMIISLRSSVREVAGERALFEREHAGGLRTSAYLVAKLGFLLPLMLGHGAAMVFLTEMTGGLLPGNGVVRLGLLVQTGVAFSCLCFGISAISRNADRAQGHAWKLWAANVLLAGALLGFPRPLGAVIHPLVTAYYGWSGCVDTLSGMVAFTPITQFVRTWFATPGEAAAALLLQGAAGVVLAAYGLKRRR